VSKPDDLANRRLNPAPNPVAKGNMVGAERFQQFFLLKGAECRIDEEEKCRGRQAKGQGADEYGCSRRGRGIDNRE
jgi:hypothetical protein